MLIMMPWVAIGGETRGRIVVESRLEPERRPSLHGKIQRYFSRWSILRHRDAAIGGFVGKTR
jgi:hypothetical protein